MNKKHLLLLLTLVFGVQQIKPATSWSEKCYANAKEFVSCLDGQTVLGVGFLAVTVGATAYGYIKDKISQKLESWAQQSDQELLARTEKYIDSLQLKYKEELQIYNQERKEADPSTKRALIVSELGFFMVKNKIVATGGYYYNPSPYLRDKIQELKDRKNQRYEQLQKTGRLEDFNFLINKATRLFDELQAIYDLIEQESHCFDLFKLSVDLYFDEKYHEYIYRYDLYKSNATSPSEYVKGLHQLISKLESDHIKFPYVYSARRLSDAATSLDRKLNDLKKHLIAVNLPSSDAMSLLSCDLCEQAQGILDALQYTHDVIVALPQYHKEVKKEQKELARQRELERERERMRREQALVEQALRNQRRMLEEQRRQNDLLAEHNWLEWQREFQKTEPVVESTINVTVVIPEKQASQDKPEVKPSTNSNASSNVQLPVNQVSQDTDQADSSDSKEKKNKKNKTSILDDAEQFFDELNNAL